MGVIVNRRRVMGGGSSLPYDAEIEYLKSSGTQWINTTWKPDLTKDFHIECKVGWVRNDRGMFLSAWQGNNNLSIELFQQRKFRIYAGSSDVINTPSQPSLNELYYIETRYTANDGACVVTIGSDSYTGNIPIAGRILNTNNIVLGSDPQHRFSYSMFGAIKIYNPNLILDLIPVRVGTTGYMYDKVSGQLFGNSGTGDFVLGPDSNREVIMTSESNPLVFAVCYAQGWCTSPNFMYKDEAEAVTDIGTTFQSNTSITHFEELQYFSALTSLVANAFNGCTALSSLVLPTSVTSLGSNCFVNCPFEELNLSNITSLGSTYTFNSCGIKYPWFPLLTRHGTASGSSSAFYSCRNLIGVRFDSITYLGSIVYNYTGNVYLVVTTQSVPDGTNPTRWPATIYVRDELIASYQAAANWSTKTIKGISQLPTDDPDCPWISDLREKGLII